MPDSTIVARFIECQWVAHFQDRPNSAYGSDGPVKAVRRLLEGNEADPGVYEILCQGEAGQETLRHSVTFPCQVCEGRGEYVGLLVREVCQGCGGRKVVK